MYVGLDDPGVDGPILFSHQHISILPFNVLLCSLVSSFLLFFIVFTSTILKCLDRLLVPGTS